jgi:heat shock protein HslJ
MSAATGAGSAWRRVLWVIAAAAVIGILAWAGRMLGPDRSGPNPPPAQPRDLLRLQGEWALTTMSFQGEVPDIAGEPPIDLTLGQTSINGSTGCQAYASVYTATAAGVFALDELGVTANTCQDATAEVSESYLSAFATVTHWSFADDGALRLLGEGVTLAFTRAREPSPDPEVLAASPWVGTWRVQSLTTPTGEIEVPADAGMWIGIDPTRATGSGGCNSFVAQVNALGARGLFFDRLVIGLKRCVDVGNAMIWESRLMEALTAAERWDASDADELRLVGEGHAVVLIKQGPPPSHRPSPAI